MPDPDALEERLRAVERALTDGNEDLTDLGDAAELTREVEVLSARLDDVEERLDELDAATQALRGYVGNIRAVNEAVERRADAALAKAETLEEEVMAEALDGDAPTVETLTTPESGLDNPETERTQKPESEGTEIEDSSAQSHPCGCTPRRTASESDTKAVEDTDCPQHGPEERGLLGRLRATLAGIV